MKKMKKVFAILVAMVMVIAMAVPAMASSVSPYNATITVNGLADGTTTTLKYYQVVSYDADAQAWKIADWAAGYVTDSTNPYQIDWAGLEGVVTDDDLYTTETETGTSHTITVPVGAYLIIASDDLATYTVMGAQTYDSSQTYLTSKNAEVDAKTSGYDVSKTADDQFVAKGETVTFTITTVFPTFQFDEDTTSGTFTIKDTPEGLDLTNAEVSSNVSTPTTNEKNADGTWTIEWTGITDNDDAGKIVTVTITAVVTADTGYKNTANTYKDGSDLGKDEVEGFSGDITITKYADDETTILSGAEFEVYKNDGTTPLSFVKVEDGVYKLAGGDAEGTETVTTIVATNGTVKVTGLDEGTYFFKETKAPDGYSINSNGATATITANNSSAVTVTGSLTDTKLSSLPSTGGIGTTIFTVAGCAIIVVAGGLLIVSRRKKSA